MILDQLDLARTALLVIDMQNAFCHPEGTLGISGVNVAPAQEVVPRIGRLIEMARDAGLPVIWTVQQHLARDAARAQKRLPAHTQKRKQVSALAGTWDAEIVAELIDLADDPTLVVTKHRFGAFYQTRLEQLLRMLGTEALIVTGVTANACVETTLREAYLRDYDVVAVPDCIAAVRPEWYAPAQEVWSQYFGVLATSDEVGEWLGRAAAPRALALHHILLQVSDIEEAERFYCGLLGLTVKGREPFRDGRPFFNTHQGLGIVSGRQGGGQIDHLALAVKGVPELASRVEQAGYQVVRPPGPGPYGLTAYVADPDGNEVELVEEAG